MPVNGGVCLVKGGIKVLPWSGGVSAWCLSAWSWGVGGLPGPGGCLPGSWGVSAWLQGGGGVWHPSALRQTLAPLIESQTPSKNSNLGHNFVAAGKIKSANWS